MCRRTPRRPGANREADPRDGRYLPHLRLCDGDGTGLTTSIFHTALRHVQVLHQECV